MAKPQGPLVFLDIDTQRDFFDPDSPAAVPNALTITNNLGRLTLYARERDVPVLATACRHDPQETTAAPEFAPHCQADSKGSERIRETRWPGSLIVAPNAPFAPPSSGKTPSHLTVQKQRFDLFTHPEADRVVEFYADGGKTFVVYGVATDLSVANTLRGLLGRGYKATLVTDATQAVDGAQVAPLMDELRGLGLSETTTDELCGPAA